MTWVRSLSWEDPLKEGMAAHSVFLSGESHGQRSLAATAPWVAESDTTEAAERAYTYTKKYTYT